jgi:HD-GYP domain-containing protein (c-di-GMP phosphodiesterase class II)
VEAIGAMCLATDLGMGFPFEHGLQGTLAAMRLGDHVGVDAETASQLYYSSLLMHAGCTADGEIAAAIFGGDLATHLVPVLHGSPRETLAGLVRALPPPESAGPGRALEVARRLPRAARAHRPHLAAMCDAARMLARRLGLPEGTADLFSYLTERWDGRGTLRRAAGDEIPLAIRVAQVARDAAYQRVLGGVEHAARVAHERAGRAFDPEIAETLARHATEILAIDPAASAWESALAREPEPPLMLSGADIDAALAAMGDFADLIAPCFAGHSRGVARLAEASGRRCGVDAVGLVAIRRAALVHDVGRVTVGARTWQRPGPISIDEWERVRLHAYHTERVLSRSSFLSTLAPIAGAHHERLDGSGYHRGARGADLPPAARLLAAADAYHAMTEPRPHRPACSAAEAAERLAEAANAGQFDPDAATAVIEAAGQAPPPVQRAAGLTEREAQVVGLLARGLQTKQVARALGISVKTADRHVQNAYGKIGASTRAAATLFAMENGIVAWGELPMVRRPPRS